LSACAHKGNVGVGRQEAATEDEVSARCSALCHGVKRLTCAFPPCLDEWGRGAMARAEAGEAGAVAVA